MRTFLLFIDLIMVAHYAMSSYSRNALLAGHDGAPPPHIGEPPTLCCRVNSVFFGRDFL
jgi:hypothetical protein